MQIPIAGYTIPTTVTDCDDAFVLPVGEFEECAEAVVQLKSEIAGIFVSLPDAADPTSAAITLLDPSDLTEWTTHIGTADADHYHVIGDMPKASKNERSISRGRKARGYKDFLINFDVDENTDANYELMRGYEGRPEIFLWFYNRGNKIYGGTTGIRTQIVDADAVFGRGDDTYELYQFVAAWQAKAHPPRNDSPFSLN